MEIKEGKVKTPLKMVVYGTEGIGKSTLASHAPNPLYIDLEGGSNQLDVRRMDPAPVKWEELLSYIDYVISNPDSCETLVIDTLDAAELMAIDYVCLKKKRPSLGDFNYGKGYEFVADEMSKLIKKLNRVIEVGINVIAIAHSQIRKFEQPDEAGAYDRYELKLLKKSAPLIKEWSDLLLFCNYKTIVETVGNSKKAYGGERRIYTTHHPAWDAKNRFGLPEEMPLDYKSIDGLLITKKDLSQNFDFDKSIEENIEDDPDFTELTETSEKIRSAGLARGIIESRIVKALMKMGQTPKNLEFGHDPVLDDFDQTYLETEILPKLDKFLSAVNQRA